MATPTARERAERDLLGAVLLAPDCWNRVQQTVKYEEIATAGLRELAEAIWDCHRNEGALPLSEFLELLPRPELKSVAIEAAHEAGRRGEPAKLAEISASDLLAEVRRDAERSAQRRPAPDQVSCRRTPNSTCSARRWSGPNDRT